MKDLTYHEGLLRRLRQDPRLWDEGSKAQQITRLIDAVRRRCAPAWQAAYEARQTARLERWLNLQ